MLWVNGDVESTLLGLNGFCPLHEYSLPVDTRNDKKKKMDYSTLRIFHDPV